MKNKKLLKSAILLLFSAILLGGGIYIVATTKTKLPDDFYDARNDAAKVSQEIVDLTNQTSETIKKTNISDADGRVTESLNLITEARATNNKAYAKASELAQNLQRLAESLLGIPTKETRKLAYESVAIELSLVSEFIVYTENLNTFFDNLARAILTNSPFERRNVQNYLKQVNAQAEKINTLNKDFIGKIEELDKSL